MKLLNSSVLLITIASSCNAFAPSTNSNTKITTTTQLQNDLWGAPPEKNNESKDKSIALPFAARPKLLDGSLPGDVGFE